MHCQRRRRIGEHRIAFCTSFLLAQPNQNSSTLPIWSGVGAFTVSVSHSQTSKPHKPTSWKLSCTCGKPDKQCKRLQTRTHRHAYIVASTCMTCTTSPRAHAVVQVRLCGHDTHVVGTDAVLALAAKKCVSSFFFSIF